MIPVNQVEGSYVSSSLPKVLMMPARPRTRHKQSIHDSHPGDALYSKAIKGTSKLNQTDKAEFDYTYGSSKGLLFPDREDVPVQTDLYLEELCDLIEEADEECQTDPLLDRPPSPLFVPAKIGVDVATQIYPGDLFDFEREIQPLLESLVGQTLEQSLIEVVTEDELKELEKQQSEYDARRSAEVAERLRLEEQERRLLEERQRRLREQEEAVRLEEETTQKIAACVFAQNYLSDLLPKVYKRLEAQGYFVAQDPEVQEIEENLWPWLMDEVSYDITTLEASYCILDSLIESAVHTITDKAIVRPVTPDQYPERPVEEEGVDEEMDLMDAAESVEGEVETLVSTVRKA